MSGYQHDELQCRILKLEVDFCRKEAWLYFPDGDCCDMNGCIAMMERFYPEVEFIFTKSGSQPDTSYFKSNTGIWVAMAWRAGTYVAA